MKAKCHRSNTDDDVSEEMEIYYVLREERERLIKIKGGNEKESLECEKGDAKEKVLKMRS